MTRGPHIEVVERKPRISHLAIASMILGILAIPLSLIYIGVVLGGFATLLGAIAVQGIRNNPEKLGGKGFAFIGMFTGTAGSITALLLFLTLIKGYHDARQSGVCAANINGMLKAMLVYANENGDSLPVPPLGTSRPDYVPLAYDPRTAAGNNNSLSPFGILIAEGSVSPKSLVCRDDPFASRTVGTLVDHPSVTVSISRIQNSYSIISPWASSTPTAESAEWWKAKIDSQRPLMADMVLAGPPLAGKPAGNSANHKGDGQNVGFADAHAEWVRDINKLASDSRTTFSLPATQPSQPMMTPHRTAAGDFVIP